MFQSNMKVLMERAAVVAWTSPAAMSSTNLLNASIATKTCSLPLWLLDRGPSTSIPTKSIGYIASKEFISPLGLSRPTLLRWQFSQLSTVFDCPHHSGPPITLGSIKSIAMSAVSGWKIVVTLLQYAILHFIRHQQTTFIIQQAVHHLIALISSSGILIMNLGNLGNLL